MEPVFHRGHRKRGTVGGWGSASGWSDVDKRELEGGGAVRTRLRVKGFSLHVDNNNLRGKFY